MGTRSTMYLRVCVILLLVSSAFTINLDSLRATVPVKVPVVVLNASELSTIPHWLGGYFVTTATPTIWNLPLTYQNGGPTYPGQFLFIRNYGPAVLTLNATSPESVNSASTFSIPADSVVQLLSDANWVSVTPGAADFIIAENFTVECSLAVGMAPAGTQCGDLTALRLALGEDANNDNGGQTLDVKTSLDASDGSRASFVFITDIAPGTGLAYRPMRFVMQSTPNTTGDFTASPVAFTFLASHLSNGSVVGSFNGINAGVTIGDGFTSLYTIARTTNIGISGVSPEAASVPTGTVTTAVGINFTPPDVGTGPLVITNSYSIYFPTQATVVTTNSAFIRMDAISGAGIINAGIWASTNTAFDILCAGLSADVCLRRAAAGAWTFGTGQDLRVPGYLGLGSASAPSNTVDGAFSTTSASPALQAIGAVTANAASGMIAFTVSTAAGACTTATVTNTNVVTGSIVMLTLQSYTGTYGTNGQPTVMRSNTSGSSSGSFVLSVCNSHATNALSGNLFIAFWVLN